MPVYCLPRQSDLGPIADVAFYQRESFRGHTCKTILHTLISMYQELQIIENWFLLHYPVMYGVKAKWTCIDTWHEHVRYVHSTHMCCSRNPSLPRRPVGTFLWPSRPSKMQTTSGNGSAVRERWCTVLNSLVPITRSECLRRTCKQFFHRSRHRIQQRTMPPGYVWSPWHLLP